MLAVIAGLVPALAASAVAVLIDRVAQGGLSDLSALAIPFGVVSLATTLQAVVPVAIPLFENSTLRTVTAEVEQRSLLVVNSIPTIDAFEDPDVLSQLSLAQQCQSAPANAVLGAVRLLQAFVMVAAMAAALYLVSPLAAALMAAAAIPDLWVELKTARLQSEHYQHAAELSRRREALVALSTEPRAARELRIYNVGAFIANRVKTARRAEDESEATLDRRVFVRQTTGSFISVVMTLMTCVVAARATDGTSAGAISLVFAAAFATQSATGSAAHIIGDVRRELDSVAWLRWMLDLSSPQAASPGETEPRTAIRSSVLELSGVSFRYPNATSDAVHDLSVTLHEGSVVAIVGANGSGKSTLLKLLCGLYRPTAGAIRLDGQDICGMTIGARSQRVSAVFQDFVQYDFTARENVAIGDLTALDGSDRIVGACRQTNVHADLLGLEHGYDTGITTRFRHGADQHRGTSLSGGQWQRVAVARGLLREGGVLALDEPTAAADAESESVLVDAIRAGAPNRLTIVVSHRPATIRAADVVLVMEHGDVVASGTHDELLVTNAAYQSIWASVRSQEVGAL